ncbi:hypothetical protein IWW38_001733, partial [Coemansia aciculifera]
MSSLGQDSSMRGRKPPAATSKETTAAAREARTRRRNIVRDSVRTKARFDSLVLRWQEKLLEPAASELLLKQAAQYLTPEDFESIIMERTSGGLCGYPLCASPTRKLKQRYHISMHQRKVFDMEEHASYCSNRCMVGSRFYKQQLSEEPVYMRDRKENLDIEVLPLDIESSQDKVALTGPNDATTSTEALRASDQSLISWYRDSLMAKMNIPKRVADANPLQIIEHSSADVVDYDLSAAVGKLQFADIEGFEPEADVSRIKKAICFANKQDKCRDIKRAESGSKSADHSTDSRVGILEPSVGGPLGASSCDSDIGGKDSDYCEANESEEDDDDKEEEEEDNSGDDDINSPASGAADNGCFAKLLKAEVQHTGVKPSLSMFSRMWMLVDRISTEKTQKYLRDLKQSSSSGAGASALNMADYYIAPGDQAMAIRHGLLLGAMARELDTVRD